ncbi:hypothetical protein CVT26_005078 [Gymnopilus dilepis]|uniref:F-box domain-containing protein n=1 Tax=Gymnopilus dilepis TaxID=231916 RepID=A0A409Y083_9AGAR|nr:hypothetical protein CVT26_005078 [Gymnopilus dilepis]
MQSFYPPPLTPVSPYFQVPPPNSAGFGVGWSHPGAPSPGVQVQPAYGPPYRPIKYDGGLLKIDIRLDPSGQVHPDIHTLTKQVMSDFPGAPLRISLWDWMPSGEHANRLSKTGIVQALCNHFQFLYGVLWRWHSVRFDLKLIEGIVVYMTGGDPHKVPHCPGALMLESVKFKNVAEVKDIKLINAFLREIMSNQMRNLYLGASDSAQPFSIQRSLRNIPYPALTRLELDGFSVSALQMHELMIATINIMECIVSDLTGPFPSPGCCKAVVPNLRRLKLDLDEIDFNGSRNTGAVFRLLETIAAPDLLELSLGYENVWDDYRYAEFYALCRPRLQKLHLLKMNVNDRQLYDCLDRHPELEELVLDMQSDHWSGGRPPIVLTQRTCKEICFNSKGESLLPNLESLSVRDNCIEATGCFSKMVKSRVKNRSLSELVIYGEVLCSEDRRVLQSLAAQGMRVIIGKEGFLP